LGWPLIGAISSVLDVGCGTGLSLQWIHDHDRTVTLHGIEPAQGMIEIARRKLPHADIRQGAGEQLPYPDKSIDAVIATGIMHHVDQPARVIGEMLRVARTAIIVSDHNNYAFGGDLARRLRMGLKLCGLLGVATYVKQGLNRQGYSDDDGWWYPYSLFDNYPQIAQAAQRVYLTPARLPVNNQNMLFAQGHFAIVAVL
jgi:SAM-dependent methyltransferase